MCAVCQGSFPLTGTEKLSRRAPAYEVALNCTARQGTRSRRSATNADFAPVRVPTEDENGSRGKFHSRTQDDRTNPPQKDIYHGVAP
jgi:hypothetical protein